MSRHTGGNMDTRRGHHNRQTAADRQQRQREDSDEDDGGGFFDFNAKLPRDMKSNKNRADYDKSALYEPDDFDQYESSAGNRRGNFDRLNDETFADDGMEEWDEDEHSQIVGQFDARVFQKQGQGHQGINSSNSNNNLGHLSSDPNNYDIDYENQLLALMLGTDDGMAGGGGMMDPMMPMEPPPEMDDPAIAGFSRAPPPPPGLGSMAAPPPGFASVSSSVKSSPQKSRYFNNETSLIDNVQDDTPMATTTAAMTTTAASLLDESTLLATTPANSTNNNNTIHASSLPLKSETSSSSSSGSKPPKFMTLDEIEEQLISETKPKPGKAVEQSLPAQQSSSSSSALPVKLSQSKALTLDELENFLISDQPKKPNPPRPSEATQPTVPTQIHPITELLQQHAKSAPHDGSHVRAQSGTEPELIGSDFDRLKEKINMFNRTTGQTAGQPAPVGVSPLTTSSPLIKPMAPPAHAGLPPYLQMARRTFPLVNPATQMLGQFPPEVSPELISRITQQRQQQAFAMAQVAAMRATMNQRPPQPPMSAGHHHPFGPPLYSDFPPLPGQGPIPPPPPHAPRQIPLNPNHPLINSLLLHPTQVVNHLIKQEQTQLLISHRQHHPHPHPPYPVHHPNDPNREQHHHHHLQANFAMVGGGRPYRQLNPHPPHPILDRPVRDPDDYTGLMTLREREFLIKIQKLQLECNNPYEDDYYYSVYMAKKAAAAQKDSEFPHENGTDDVSGLPLGLLPRASDDSRGPDATAPYAPRQFEGSLGKLTAASLSRPRQLLNITEEVTTTTATEPVSSSLAVDNSDAISIVSESVVLKSLSSKHQLSNYRRLLLNIERLYLLMLHIGDEDKKMAVLPPDQQATFVNSRTEMMSKLLDGILHQSSRLPAISAEGSSRVATTPLSFTTEIVQVRKGLTLVLRVIPLLDGYPKELSALLAALLESRVFREAVDKFSKDIYKTHQLDVGRVFVQAIASLAHAVHRIAKTQNEENKENDEDQNKDCEPLEYFIRVFSGALHDSKLFNKYYFIHEVCYSLLRHSQSYVKSSSSDSKQQWIKILTKLRSVCETIREDKTKTDEENEKRLELKKSILSFTNEHARLV